MSYDKGPGGFPDAEAHKLYRWWEQELSDEARTYLLNGYIWQGTPQERLEKLKEMRAKYALLECYVCEKRFDTLEELVKHFNENHKSYSTLESTHKQRERKLNEL